MLLTPQEVGLFFKLHWALLFFVNQRLQVLPDDVASPDAFSSLSPEVRLKVRDAFLKHTDLLEEFADENPVHLPTDQLDIVRSWVSADTGLSTDALGQEIEATMRDERNPRAQPTASTRLP